MLRKMEARVSKQIELAKIATKGAFHLFTAKVISRIIGVAGGLVLIRMLKPEEYGLMAIAMVLPGILSLFRDPGVGSAVTKFTAEYRAKGEYSRMKPLVAAALLFRLALSTTLTLTCFALVDVFASSILVKPYMASLIKVAAFSILAWDFYFFALSVFMGLDLTEEYGLLMVLGEALMAVFPVALVVLGMGVSGAILGNILAIAIAGSIGISMSIRASFRVSGRYESSMKVKKALKLILTYGLPIEVAFLIGTGLTRYYDFMIVMYADPKDIGYYSAVGKVSALLGYLSFPVATVLFPAFSKINTIEEHEVLGRVFKYSVKYSSLIIVPAATFTILLARSLISLFLGEAYEGAWLYLALLAVGYLYYGCGRPHMMNLLSSQGETKFIMKTDALTVALGVPIGFALISNYGVLGMLLTGLMVGWPSYFIILRKVYHSFKVKPPFIDTAKIYVSSATSYLTALAFTSLCSNEFTKIVIGMLIGVTVYPAALLTTKAINRYDIQNLKEITRPLPIIGNAANRVLSFIEFIVNWCSKEYPH